MTHFAFRHRLALAALVLAVAPALGARDSARPAAPAPATAVPVDAVSFQLAGAPRVERGAQSELAFELQITRGYAILSSQLEQAGLVAAAVSFQRVNNIAIGAARFPKARLFRVGEKRLAAYEGALRVRIPVTVLPSTMPGLRELRGKLVYQVCSATECFAPVRQALALRLDVTP